jgi:Deoxyribonuclease NucA/NucB
MLLAVALVFTGCESVPEPVATPQRDCTRPQGVATISFSRTKYPNIRRHFRRAVRDGWPRVLVLHRRGADQRRDELLDDYPTRDGYDRDEYPPAVGRRRTAADVAYVPSSENRSHGATLGVKLRRFCDGTRFRYVFY